MSPMWVFWSGYFLGLAIEKWFVYAGLPDFTIFPAVTTTVLAVLAGGYALVTQQT